MFQEFTEILPIIGLAVGFLVFLAIAQAFEKDPPHKPIPAAKSEWVPPVKPQKSIDSLRRTYSRKFSHTPTDKEILEELCLDCFLMINAELSKPLLRVPQIEITANTPPGAPFAHARPWDNTISMHPLFVQDQGPFNIRNLPQLMIHEMLHIWMDQNHIAPTEDIHGPTFHKYEELLQTKPLFTYRDKQFEWKDPLRFVKKANGIPPGPHIVPVVDTSLQALEKLRTSCLTLFEKKPLKNIPQLFVEEDAHFSKPTICAHYHTSKDAICFRKGYLLTASPSSLLDTMKHELLHAWIEQHDFKGDRHHDDIFKAAAELLGIHWWEGLREY